MGLIKSNNMQQGVSAFSINDIEAQALALLNRAQAKVDQMVAHAKTHADELKSKSMKEGRDAGHAEGLKAGKELGIKQGQQQAVTEQKQKLVELMAMLTRVVSEFEHDRRQLEAQARDQLLALAIEIGQRVTRRAIRVNSDFVHATVHEAIRLTVNKSSVRILINPAQRQLMLKLLPDLKLTWPTLMHVELVDDAAIEPGGCRIIGGSGEVDATVATQLDRIAAELIPDRPLPVEVEPSPKTASVEPTKFDGMVD